jgi:hypothetical protein
MQLSRVLCFIGTLAFLLASCGPVPTPYQPRDSDGYGYTDTHLGDNTYRVTFVGNPQTPIESVDRYALYRSAQVTLERGADYFTIVTLTGSVYTSPIMGRENDRSAAKTIRIYSGQRSESNPYTFAAREFLSNMKEQLAEDKERGKDAATRGQMTLYLIDAGVIILLAVYLLTRK